MNMEVNQGTIEHLAKLSNMALTEDEVNGLTRNIADIVSYISQLDELDTTNIEPTYQVFEMKNIWRADTILEQEANSLQLLALSQEVHNNQIKVPKVL